MVLWPLGFEVGFVEVLSNKKQATNNVDEYMTIYNLTISKLWGNKKSKKIIDCIGPSYAASVHAHPTGTVRLLVADLATPETQGWASSSRVSTGTFPILWVFGLIVQHLNGRGGCAIASRLVSRMRPPWRRHSHCRRHWHRRL